MDNGTYIYLVAPFIYSFILLSGVSGWYILGHEGIGMGNTLEGAFIILGGSDIDFFGGVYIVVVFWLVGVTFLLDDGRISYSRIAGFCTKNVWSLMASRKEEVCIAERSFFECGAFDG